MKRHNSNERGDFYRVTTSDAVLIVLILLISTGVILFTRFGLKWQASKISEALVYHEGKLLQHPRLDKDQEIVLLKGKMIAEIKEGRIRVRESDCPRRICVNRGWIKAPGQIIVCVPNKVLIEIKRATTPFLDAVVS